jgi:predicted nucleic acid-binding protein
LIVLDASAAVCVLVGRPAERARRVAQRFQNEELNAPYLLDLEVANALRRLVRLGDATFAEAVRALEELAIAPINRHVHVPLLARVWEMRENRTSYDAAYVALAELLGAPLITLDAPMARTPAGVPIEVF